MRYFGGKARLGKELAKVIEKCCPNMQRYHEPFCGMFSVGKLISAPVRTASDFQQDLILMLSAIRDGWVPPETLGEDEYACLKLSEPSPLRAFAGFGCSNSGKFFGGYARDSTGRNYAGNARRSLLKMAPLIKGVEFNYEPYWDYFGSADVIYCDPPYKGTTGFTTGGFDHDLFYRWVELMSSRGSRVFVSEYTAPPHWKLVWEKPVLTDMKDKSKNRINRLERLFTV